MKTPDIKLQVTHRSSVTHIRLKEEATTVNMVKDCFCCARYAGGDS